MTMINDILSISPINGQIIMLALLLIAIAWVAKGSKALKAWVTAIIILVSSVAVGFNTHSTIQGMTEQHQEQQQQQQLIVHDSQDLEGVDGKYRSASGDLLTLNPGQSHFATLREFAEAMNNAPYRDQMLALLGQVGVSAEAIERSIQLEEKRGETAMAILLTGDRQGLSDKQAREEIISKLDLEADQVKNMPVVRALVIKNTYVDSNDQVVVYTDARSEVRLALVFTVQNNRKDIRRAVALAECGNIFTIVDKKKEGQPKPVQKPQPQPEPKPKPVPPQPIPPQPIPPQPQTKEIHLKKVFKDLPMFVTKPSVIKVSIMVDGKQIKVVTLEKSKDYQTVIKLSLLKGQNLSFKELNVPKHFHPSISVDDKWSVNKISVIITNTYIGGGGGGLQKKSDDPNAYVYPDKKSGDNQVDPTQAEEVAPKMDDQDRAQPAPPPTQEEVNNQQAHDEAVHTAEPLPGGEDAPPNDGEIMPPSNPNGGN